MNPREWGQPVNRGIPRRQDMPNLDAACRQRIGDELPVTLPPLRLRAHDGDEALGRKREKFLDAQIELSGLHVIGISTEARMTPPAVR